MMEILHQILCSLNLKALVKDVFFLYNLDKIGVDIMPLEIFKMTEVLNLLHDTLEAEETINKVSVFSPNGEKYGYNQYSLMIVMDFLIKYCIVIKDTKNFSYCIEELKKIIFSYNDHKELVLSFNELLGELIRLKLNLTNKTSSDNKRKILLYLYEEYIVNGYMFHSFPSAFKELVEAKGIDAKAYSYPIFYMKKLYYIFKNHKYDDMIPKYLLDGITSISITDSPAMAYYYAFRSPQYFCNLVATSKYYKDNASYDYEAYYRKDMDACRNNLLLLAKHLNMTDKEKDTVITAFEEQWNLLDASNSLPEIAFISRKDVGKNSLYDIDEIIKKSKYEDLVVSIARITDSRYSHIRRYSPLFPLSFTVKTFPSYREVKANKFIVKEKEEVVEKKEKESVIVPKRSVSYGYASILSLLGLIFISLGCTLLIIFKHYGIGGV